MSQNEDQDSNGPWTKDIYKENEGPALKAVRELAEYLNLPKENVLYLVPNDPRAREKVGEFVSNLVWKFTEKEERAMVWVQNADEHINKELLLKMLE